MEDPSDLQIRFERAGEELPDAPAPVPASLALPEWLRAMPAATAPETRLPEDQTHLTVRACAPFTDAMAAGYLLLWPSTVTITLHGRAPSGDYRISFQPAEPAFLMAHPERQAPGMPGSALPLLKLVSPWIVRTPPGTSSLVAPLFNRLDRPFIPCAAVIESDRFGLPFHLPFFFIPPSTGTVTIERGEPFAQVLPFRRENWIHVVGAAAPEDLDRTRRLLGSRSHGSYVRHFRVRKQFD